jgi:hypothetical protein
MFGKRLFCATEARELPSVRIVTITKELLYFDFTHPLDRVRGQAYRSIGGKALGAELFTRQFNSLPGRRLNVVEPIAEFKFFPLESAHLVKGENIDSFYITETGGEFRNIRNVLGAIGQAGYQDEANPDRFLSGR